MIYKVTGETRILNKVWMSYSHELFSRDATNVKSRLF